MESKKRQILEKHWKEFRLSIAQKYEPMSDKAYEFIENAMEEYASSMPKPNTGDMWQFLLVNALRNLTAEQQAGLCFDLYCRNGLTKIIDKRISEHKQPQPRKTQ